MRFIIAFLAATLCASFCGAVQATQSSLIQKATLLLPKTISKDLKKKYELIFRELDFNVRINFRRKPFQFLFDSSEQNVCRNIHSLIENERCKKLFKKDLHGKGQIGLAVSLKRYGDEIGFWFYVVSADKSQADYVRHGKLSASRTDGCFGLVFRRVVESLLDTNKAQDPDSITVKELKLHTCVPKRKIVLTSKMIAQGRPFFSDLRKKLRGRGFIMDLSFQEPTEKTMKRVVGCKTFQRQCQRDYARQVKAESRLVFEGSSAASGVGETVELHKYVPDSSVSGGERKETLEWRFRPFALTHRGCRKQAVQAAFAWIVSRKAMQVSLPAICNVSHVKPVHKPTFSAGVITLGLGIGTVITGIIFGMKAHAEQKVFESMYQNATTQGDIYALNESWKRGKEVAGYSNIATGIGIAFVVVGGVGLAVGIINPFSKKPTPPKPKRAMKAPPPTVVVGQILFRSE